MSGCVLRWFSGAKNRRPSISDTIGAIGLSEIIEYTARIDPELPSLIRATVDRQVTHFKKEMKQLDTPAMFKDACSRIMETCKSRVSQENMTEITKRMVGAQGIVELSSSCDKSTDAAEQFQKRVELSKRCLDETNNVLNIVSIGKTSTGKSATIKAAFNLDDDTLKLKGGLTSDTLDIKQHSGIINGVKVNYTDSPGTDDSRGQAQDDANVMAVVNYLIKNDIDVITWTARIGDLLTTSHQKIIEYMSCALGPDFWDKLIVVLTFANDDPPDEYIGNSAEIAQYLGLSTAEKAKVDLEAWSKYKQAKERTWHESLMAIQKRVCLTYKGKRVPIDVPIVFVENSIRKSLMSKDGVRLLKDETPILSTFMYHVFKVINPEKIPALFLSMAGNLPVAAKPIASPIKVVTPLVRHSAPIAINGDPKGKEELDEDLGLYDDNLDELLNVVAVPAPMPVIVLTEQQKALNVAATKLVDDPTMHEKVAAAAASGTSGTGGSFFRRVKETCSVL
jgi:predicted GTPase